VNPAGTAPWAHAAVRHVSTASNGLEFANRLPSNSWSVVAAHPAPWSVTDGKPFDVSIEVHGTNATWTSEGQQIQTTQSLQRTQDGVLGLIMDQATASFRHLTVTQLPPRPTIPLVEPGHTGLAIGHRGNPKAAPEDTLVSEVQNYKLGGAYMELDLHLTKDNVPVVMHDDTVDRTTNGTGRIDSLTVDQLKLLDAGVKFDPAYAGTKVPTFEEVLQYAKRTGGHIMPELKAGWTKDQVQIVTGLVEQYGLQSHTVWQSFDPVPLEHAYELDPSIARAGLISGKLPADPVAYVEAFHGQALLPAANLVTPDLMRTMHAAGLAVVVWTVDKADDWAKLTAAGVDGIMSNSVGELIGWMARYNQETPTSAPIEQTVTLDGTADHAVGEEPFTVTATGGASGNPVVLSAVSDGVCAMSGGTVYLLAPGQCTVTATQAGNAEYAAANPVSRTFTVTPLTAERVAPTLMVVKPGEGSRIGDRLDVKLKLGGRNLRALTLLVDGAPVRSVVHPNTGMLTLTLKANELGDLARGSHALAATLAAANGESATVTTTIVR
jgi:glycerophosphoryl diester phosphodiesterase